MIDFELYNPVRIFFGKEALGHLPEQVHGYSRILLLYSGDRIKKIGLYDKLVPLLAGKDILEFNEISSNPRYESCMKCVNIIKERPVDFILAVGGGSVIDAAKFISTAYYYTEGDSWELLSKGASFEKVLPFGVVLTLAATGSEMTCHSVISRESTEEKLSFSNPKIYSKFSLLDPKVTFSLPTRQIVNGIIDTFVHIAEQYLAVNESTELQDRFCEGVLKTVIEKGPLAIENPEDYDTRATLMWAATMAINGIITAGTRGDWSTHMIGHELTALYGIDHAVSVAIIFPGVLSQQKEKKHNRLVLFAEKVWGIKGENTKEIVEECIEATEEFFSRLLGKELRLREFGIPNESAKKIRERIDSRGWRLGESADIDGQIVEQILHSRY